MIVKIGVGARLFVSARLCLCWFFRLSVGIKIWVSYNLNLLPFIKFICKGYHDVKKKIVWRSDWEKRERAVSFSQLQMIMFCVGWPRPYNCRYFNSGKWQVPAHSHLRDCEDVSWGWGELRPNHKKRFKKVLSRKISSIFFLSDLELRMLGTCECDVYISIQMLRWVIHAHAHAYTHSLACMHTLSRTLKVWYTLDRQVYQIWWLNYGKKVASLIRNWW